MRHLAGVLIVLVVAGTGLTAQRPRFEVASVRVVVRPTPPVATRSNITLTDARLDVRSYRFYDLLLYAFEAKPFQLAVPEWVRDHPMRLEIQATIPDGVPKSQARTMLQALLAERLGMTFHVEPRVVTPAYDLVVAPGGLNPVRVREVEAADELTRTFPLQPDERAIREDTSAGVRLINTFPQATRRITDRTNYVIRAVGIPTVKYELDATRMTMSELASELQIRISMPMPAVVDETGLGAIYQFKMDLPQMAGLEEVARRAGLTTNVRGEPIDFGLASNINVFKQVEGLGLRLIERKAPIDVIVIDSLNRTPTEN